MWIFRIPGTGSLNLSLRPIFFLFLDYMLLHWHLVICVIIYTTENCCKCTKHWNKPFVKKVPQFFFLFKYRTITKIRYMYYVCTMFNSIDRLQFVLSKIISFNPTSSQKKKKKIVITSYIKQYKFNFHYPVPWLGPN